ncbi:hypothetical protein [Acinetobacter sp. 1000160]|uniref:hypothetical protein n=1 Tax=Acinetobacter sp. 1000160 TaxID=1310800 RepID=UPI00044D461C|nr:hypothetical protein [Acinetobacter sp. 1000160]EYT17880.1 hypothetical protein J699_02758 [Acinetobacter sp. 1000160]
MLKEDIDKFEYELIFADFQETIGELQRRVVRLLNHNSKFLESLPFNSTELRSEFKDFLDFLGSDFLEFFDENPKYIRMTINGQNIIDLINSISSYMPENFTFTSTGEVRKIIEKLNSLRNFYNRLQNIALDERTKDQYLKELQEELFKARESVKQVEAAKLALEGQKTEEVYSSASSIFKLESEKYERYFYISFFTIITIAIFSTFAFPFTEKTIVDFIVRKVLFISVGITLCTYFLRKASHAKKQYDQSHQTSLELMALPLFIRGLPESEQHIVIKDLTTKYFGKAVDQTQNDKAGDLINDQIKVGTELIRASVEMVKVVKPSTDLLKPSTAITEPKARATEHTTESQMPPTEKKLF